MPLCLKRRWGDRTRLLLPDGQVVWLTISRPDRGAGVVLIVDAPASVVIDREERLARTAEQQK